MQPPPQGPWGPPPQPHYPPQGAPGGYPPPHMTHASWAVSKLDQELQNWLIITGVGWFAGFMFLVGPLAWWKGSELRAKYESLGAPVPGNVGVLRLVGILTCVLCAVIAFVVVAFLVFGMAWAARHGVARY